MDKLAEQLAELSLIVRKQTGASSSDRRETPRPCSFCQKPGHGANSCPENPHRDTRCSKCGRLGHSVATCYSRQKGTEKQRSPSTGRDDSSRSNQVTVVTATPDVVGTTKRTMTGEAVPKQRRAEGINTENLMHPTPGRIIPPLQLEPLPIRGKKDRKAKEKNTSKKVLQDHVGKYDVVGELANASTGLTFGQLLRGDAAEAAKEIRRLFSPLKNRRLSKAAPALNVQNKRVLMVAPVRIFGREIRALLDTGAIPNIISADLARQLCLLPKRTKQRITVADGSSANCIGRVKDVPITFGNLTASMDFLTIEKAPIGLIIGLPAMEDLQAKLDIGSRVVEIQLGKESARIGLEPDNGLHFLPQGGSESEDFTSLSTDEGASTTSSGEEDEGTLIVAHVDSAKPQIAVEEESDLSETEEHDKLIEEKLVHLSPSDRRVISESLKDYGIVAWSFHDLRKADVPVKHSFELEDDTPVYHQPRRLSPKHNEVVRSEIDRMLEAGIITPASSAWSFLVVIATKKDGKPRFCVDYRILNRKIKPDRWPLPRIEEIFDELGGNSLFTTLDLFSG